MKLYIGIELFKQKWSRDEKIVLSHGTTMAYENLEELKKVTDPIKDKYKIVEIEI